MNKKNGKTNIFFHFEWSVHFIEPDNSWKNNKEFNGKKKLLHDLLTLIHQFIKNHLVFSHCKSSILLILWDTCIWTSFHEITKKYTRKWIEKKPKYDTRGFSQSIDKWRYSVHRTHRMVKFVSQRVQFICNEIMCRY